MSDWKIADGGITAPKGFRAAAIAAGIKKAKGALDLALIVSDGAPTSAAGLFTTNRVVAAPVVVSREALRRSRGRARAIVANSGNANACTGAEGLAAARATARATAKLLGIPPQEVLIASTGVIGVPLRAKAITPHLPRLKDQLSAQNARAAAEAIMTTDTIPKICALRADFRGVPVHIAGIAKGAGMIHPRMATMLAFITTDAAVSPETLHKMLRGAAETSFNRVSVDGDTSTNDTVFALASGLSGVAIGREGSAARKFQEGLGEVCEQLARLIAKDGEGAKKFVTVEVTGAPSERDAERIARAISNSPLSKTAIAGSDPNWGRFIAAAGYSGAHFDPGRVDISVNGLLLCRRGLDAGFDEAAAKRLLDGREITLRLDLHQGKASARMWTCDLTHEYITINASYRT